MKVISLYAIDTMWWIAILTLGMAGKLVSSRMRTVRRRVSPPLKPIYFPKLKSTVEVDKIPWWWRDNAVGPHAGENRKPLRFKAGGLSGIAPKMIPAVVRSRDFITEVSEITNTYMHIYIYVYIHQRVISSREIFLIRVPLTCPFHISRQPSISRKTLSLSPIRQDGHLMLDIFSPLYFPSSTIVLPF